MVFDLAYKEIAHSIILIDEPELHLHPSLTFRYIETLKDLGGGTNQIILFTHSADLISTYYSTGNVFVINSATTETNQALKLSTLDENHSAVARVTSSSLGMFAVGKNLIFVEGRDTSVDRFVFNKIIRNGFPHFQIVPIGSVENITKLRSVVDELTNNIFGIDLFFIRDRDGLSDEIVSSLETNSHFRCLPRRHIENYLLDTEILSKVAKSLNFDTDKQDLKKIEAALLNIAANSIMSGVLWNIREYIKTMAGLAQPSIKTDVLNQMSPDQLAENISEQLRGGLEEISTSFKSSELKDLVIKEHTNLNKSLLSGDWRKLLPGKFIFGRFCGEFFYKNSEMIRDRYVDIAIQTKPDVFQDIIEIFQTFSKIKTSS